METKEQKLNKVNSKAEEFQKLLLGIIPDGNTNPMMALGFQRLHEALSWWNLAIVQSSDIIKPGGGL